MKKIKKKYNESSEKVGNINACNLFKDEKKGQPLTATTVNKKQNKKIKNFLNTL